MKTYTEAKSYLRDKGLKTKEEYAIWWLANKEENERIGLPQFPEEFYKGEVTKIKHN
jgi:hypothetical protein